MSRWIFLFFSLVAFTATAGDQFQDAGYLKDRVGNRVFTVRMLGSVTKAQALGYARGKPHAAGRMTAVYFYPLGAVVPADGITLAGNVARANSVLYEMSGLSAWRYAFMAGRDGVITMVDCAATPGADLCRQ